MTSETVLVAEAAAKPNATCEIESNAPGPVTEALDELLDTVIDHPLIPAPGAVLSVRTKDWRYIASAGFADPDLSTPLDCATPYQIGSSTKMMTAAIVLQLSEEGKLSLDDPLSKHLPDIASRLPHGEAMTLRQFLQHTSGVYSYTDNAPDGTPGLMEGDMTDRAALVRPVSPSEMIDFVVEHGKPDFLPGTDGSWSYSNTGFVLLGMVIEKLEGKPFGKSLETRIFEPLGMKNSYLWNGVPRPEFGLPRAFLQGTEYETTNWNMSQGWAAGGVISTADDMHLFIEGLLRGELFQSAETLATMRSTVRVSPSVSLPRYGMGLFLKTGQLWGHGGQTLGYISDVVGNEDISIVGFGTASSGLMSAAGTQVMTALRSVGAAPSPQPLRPLDLESFQGAISSLTEEQISNLDAVIFEASAQELQSAMTKGDLDAVTLTTYYLHRIQKYDHLGLNSVLQLNPRVLDEALELDKERQEGRLRGPLHGIPVLLKDNISTAGPMSTTAGSAAFMNNVASRDAHIADQLRQAGALILGKGNLSEFANWMDPNLPNGFSAVGGQTVSPYDPKLDPSGSSTGPAVAVSANLVTLSVGTETSGSIVAPSARNGVVGMYPSRGLVSRDLILPLASSQDTAGPITRNVADAALLLTAISGVDENDATTGAARSLAGTDFTRFLDKDALRGKRVGVLGILPSFLENEDLLKQLGWNVVINGLEAAGAEFTVLDPGEAPRFSLRDLLVPSFKIDMNSYLQVNASDGSPESVSDIVRFNNANPADHQPFGQGNLEASSMSETTAEEYNEGIEDLRSAAAAYLDRLLSENDVDVIVGLGTNLSGIYPTAGYPAITVPGGLNNEGTPFGVTFVGPYLSDGDLLGMAYAFEQASKARVIPQVGALSE